MAAVAAPLFMVLGAVGIVYGAFLAMAQTDVKRLSGVLLGQPPATWSSACSP